METQERNNKKASRISAGSRLEDMIPEAARRRFNLVLKAERLADIPASFHAPDFFDEVPLYSRYSQVDFLKRYGDVDQLLLELTLEYLLKVEAEFTTRKAKAFSAVTIVRDDPENYIVPYIFVCKRRAELKDLDLLPPSSKLGKHVRDLLRKANRASAYRVLEDRSISPNDVKVFIGHKSAYQDMFSLNSVARGRKHAMPEHK